ncbi:hypothetical protein GWI33_019870 [Rhynchophorus ferrugineus]|uniref:Ionotropic receptor n=1 Tax=Rhynchophorus ferrugineus TaxID=354439 RepID=A0A834HTJ1_RHYFE|nr:hypothetical protein GWI33_019870 [Rhynchophorus ferrugineus]
MKTTYYVININEDNELYIRNPYNELISFNNIFLCIFAEDTIWDESFEKLLESHIFRPRHHYLIFVENMSDHDVQQYTNMLFQKYFIVNVSFIHSKNDIQHITRYNPFKRNILQSSNDIEIIFEDICKDLHGYELKLSIFPYYTATWVQDHFEGRDGYVALEVIRHLNATVKYIRPPNDETHGFVLGNGTVTGQLKQILDRSVHVSLNTGPIELVYYDLVDYTYPHDYDDYRILLPIAEPLITNLFSVIPRNLWIFTMIFLTIFSMFLKFYGKITWGLTILINIRLLAWVTIRTPIRKYRMIIAAAIFYCYIMNTYFQSKLTSVLSIPKGKTELRTLKELAESDLVFYSDEFLWYPISNMDGPDSKSMKEIKARNTFLPIDDYLKKAAPCPSNAAFIVTDYMYPVYRIKLKKIRSHSANCFYHLEQVLTSNILAFKVMKGSPLTDRLTRIIQGVVEAGLRQHWDELLFNSDIHRASKEPKKITIRNVLLCFNLLVIGLVVSFLIFFIEIILNKYYK